jgi:low affinity Fe/Cu permease
MEKVSDLNTHVGGNDGFRRFAKRIAELTGTARAFVWASVVIVMWLVTGPVFGFSDTWQLVINTGTTIVTFLMVFLIQNTQNRDSKAIHLKLDEIIRSIKPARNSFMDVEDLTDEELEHLREEFGKIISKIRKKE